MNNGKAIAGYWEATFRGKLSGSELTIFDVILRETALEDAREAIDEIAALGGYPPTAQRIAELAEPYRKTRALERITQEKQALVDGSRPMSFEDWQANVATEAEKASMLRTMPRLAAKYGIALGGDA